MQSSLYKTISTARDSKHLLSTLQLGSEVEALKELNKFILIHGVEDIVQMTIPGHDNSYTDSILSYCCKQNYIQFVTRLVEIDYPIDHGSTYSDTNNPFHLITPLAIACNRGHIECIEILIKNNARLTPIVNTGYNFLILSRSVEVYNLLLGESERRKCLNEVISTGILSGASIFRFHCDIGSIAVVEELMKIKNYIQPENIRFLLGRARMASWKYKDGSERFNNICLSLRTFLNPKKPSLEFEDYSSVSYDLPVVYNYLFGDTKECNDNSLQFKKEKVLKEALSKLYSLFISPHKCICYLQFLNDELLRYFSLKHGKEFPELDPTSYEFKIINGLYYPVPNEGYVGIKKMSALQELLISVFKKYNLSEMAVEWIGFIPHQQADENVMNGDFITESRIGAGLFHGKVSHMLQQLFLIYAIEQGEINLTFDFLGEQKTITVKDILGAFFTMKTVPQNKNLWSIARDERNSNFIKFSDPYTLNSFTMRKGQNLGFRALSDYMIDTFCKGLQAYKEAYNQTTTLYVKNCDEFIEHMDDQNSLEFFTPPSLIEYDIQRKVESKGIKLSIFSRSTDYAILPKKYDINDSFVPQTFLRT